MKRIYLCFISTLFFLGLSCSYAQASSLVYSDDFESGYGNWSNVTTGDNKNWTRDSGGTPSSSTGPSTGAGGSTYYIYLETSSGSAYTAGDTAILQGPSITDTGIHLEFQYHMYGSNMGTLAVDVLESGTWVNDVWSISGQQQTSNSAAYTAVDVDLSAYSVSQIRFRATAAGGYMGDMAIDNVEIWRTPTGPVAPVFNSDPLVKSDAIQDQPYSDSIAADASDANNDPLTFSKISGPAWLTVGSDGALSGTPDSSDVGANSFEVEVSDGDLTDTATLNITVNDDSTPIILSSSDFETGFGDWSNVTTGDNKNWTRDSGGTPSSGTGPSSGADGSAYYMYLETSSGDAYTAGDTAILLGPTVSGANISMAFQYHMYGSNMGTLAVDVLEGGTWVNDVWTISGQQQTSNSAAYTAVDVNLGMYTVSQIRFRATAAGGYRGDMAIDNVEISSNPNMIDSDGDGVTDSLDQCPNTPAGETVDVNGCADSQKDTDNDGVTDDLDLCPNTPVGEAVDSDGCADSQKDTDNDGVTDDLDLCPNTPAGETVDSDGCADSQRDTDNDGVTDDLDLCPNTPAGETVDANGCADSERDSDFDGTIDILDNCPNDPAKIEPGNCGCGVIERDYDGDGTPECRAGDITIITDTNDNVASNSLRKAIVDANSNGVFDLIILQNSSSHLLSIAGQNEDSSNTGDLDITEDVEILGKDSIVDASGIDRVLHIHSNANVIIRDLEIKGGQTSNKHGGGIYVEGNGSLTMDNCNINNNATGPQNDWGTAYGGYGGGIYINTNGVLELNACNVSDNQTGSAPANVYGGGHGGSGGGIAANNASLTIHDSDIINNDAGNGDNTVYGDGLGGAGGGIWISSGTTEITGTTISGNVSGNGYSSTGNTGDTGEGGDGGGVYLYNGTITINECTVSSNRTGSGNDGGSSGQGGGLHVDTTETVVISNSTIKNNQTGRGSWYSGHGGGIYFNGSGQRNIANSTISGNSTGYGQRAGNGAGIYTYGGVLNVDNSTISFNDGGDASSIGSTDTCYDVYSAYGGGGIYAAYGDVVFKNTIVANNTVEVDNCGTDGRSQSATFTSSGFNLIGNNASWSFTSSLTDIIGTSSLPVDPLLAPLADNGGLTETHALNSGSPAIDSGECTDIDGNPVLFDQRGYDRDDGSCDIGSYEQ